MKKNIFKLFSALAVSATVLTGCIEETFPENSTATSDQIGTSASALEGMVNGLPSQQVQWYFVYGSAEQEETDMGYPMYMIAQTEMLGDMMALGSEPGYDWFYPYNTGHTAFGEQDTYSYLPWFTLYRFIKSNNDIIGTIDLESEATTTEMKGFAGIAYAERAFNYYMLMTLFEPVDNIYTDCSNVLGLTVPIVTEATDPEAAKNNPRVSHDEMMAFILSDLDKAEELLADYTPSSGLFPSLAVVYGIKAKVYMWDEDYANAATYARMAIDTFGGTPVTEAQWLDMTTAFNTANQAWMWYLTYSPENMSNLCNFIGHISGEAQWGYSVLSYPGILSSLYDHIADTDFRKYSFIDPAKFDFYDYQSPLGAEWIENAIPYQSIKFRCKQGDVNTYTVGGAADVPKMRVEEMYFIEAEAVGMSQGVAAGVAKLNSFMQTYRDPAYNFNTSDAREFQLEVMWQMRIEFWGEGVAFPTAKRLQPDAIQNYEGTNAPSDRFKINCRGIKPQWNLVIPIEEVDANVALQGNNNPNPSGVVTGPTPIGEFAPGNN